MAAERLGRGIPLCLLLSFQEEVDFALAAPGHALPRLGVAAALDTETRSTCHATILGSRASVGSQSPQPHLEDGFVYRQNRPTDTHLAGAAARAPDVSPSQGGSLPHPQPRIPQQTDNSLALARARCYY